ncbi:hypothetical protein ACWKWU_08815 [Chitinophaga lutea]
MSKHLLIKCAAALAVPMVFFACAEYDTAELVNCEKAAINIQSGSVNTTLKIRSSNLLRTEGQGISFKLLSLTATAGDTLNVVMNVTDGPYNSIRLQSDSLQLKTYSYSRKAGSDTSGKVLIGYRDQYLVTDSSAVTLTEVDTKAKTVTGSYYVRTATNGVIASGAFTKVCFLSVK